MRCGVSTARARATGRVTLGQDSDLLGLWHVLGLQNSPVHFIRWDFRIHFKHRSFQFLSVPPRRPYRAHLRPSYQADRPHPSTRTTHAVPLVFQHSLPLTLVVRAAVVILGIFQRSNASTQSRRIMLSESLHRYTHMHNLIFSL